VNLSELVRGVMETGVVDDQGNQRPLTQGELVKRATDAGHTLTKQTVSYALNPHRQMSAFPSRAGVLAWSLALDCSILDVVLASTESLYPGLLTWMPERPDEVVVATTERRSADELDKLRTTIRHIAVNAPR
jgi:hypothetical protein